MIFISFMRDGDIDGDGQREDLAYAHLYRNLQHHIYVSLNHEGVILLSIHIRDVRAQGPSTTFASHGQYVVTNK